MAREIFFTTPAGNKRGRIVVRNPWGVLGLSLITLGIYTAFWWYFINAELRSVGRARGTDGLGDSPALSTVAFVVGALLLYVPLIWTLVTTCRRIRRAEASVGIAPVDRLNGWIVGLLAVFTLFWGAWVYLQFHLNEVWESAPIAELDEGLAGLLR